MSDQVMFQNSILNNEVKIHIVVSLFYRNTDSRKKQQYENDSSYKCARQTNVQYAEKIHYLRYICIKGNDSYGCLKLVCWDMRTYLFVHLQETNMAMININNARTALSSLFSTHMTYSRQSKKVNTIDITYNPL